MKKYFSILLTLCASFAFAGDTPVFDEADDSDCRIFSAIPFSANEPLFEEDDDQDEIAIGEETPVEDPAYAASGRCGEEGCDCNVDDSDETDETTYYCCGEEDQEESERGIGTPQPFRSPSFNKRELAKCNSYNSWKRYKSNFGMEKIFVRFPQNPAITQSSTLMTAYAYDHAVMYSFAGYFPPMGNIDPLDWFDEILYSVSGYPYNLVSHCIFQVTNGDWILDYVLHDYVQNLIVKARAVVTPFNGYVLQCVKPNGARDYFNYFLDNFWIQCECHG
ncbi:MAG: hypothetical protein JJU12_00495 [Chlamydiales bacterium]|nr:hypothetical protein [Chlamydiales bacterium]